KASVLSLSTLWLGPTLLWLKSPVPNLEDQIVLVSMRENGNGETVSFSSRVFEFLVWLCCRSPSHGPENELITKSSMNQFPSAGQIE
ncbi:hypothetical protein C0J52_17291, partial [Blattella germanica]